MPGLCQICNFCFWMLLMQWRLMKKSPGSPLWQKQKSVVCHCSLFEDRMRVLAGKIEKLGNPPNPNESKCEARKRYNKMMAAEDQACTSELTGIWIGYSEGYKRHRVLRKTSRMYVGL